MQTAYITALYELMGEDRQVCSLLSDSGTEYDEMMFREFPDQCFNFGIAEENKVGASSGMASCGKIPFVYTTGAFLAYRSYEFIRDDICFQNANVKIIGMGSGTAWSTLGPSHHATEDISVLRAIPNLTLLSPASPLEVSKCVRAAYEIRGPVYIRIGMSKEKEIYEKDYLFNVGKNIRILDGSDITILVTGSIISEVIKASEVLRSHEISARVINVHTIKPLDRESIINAAGETGYLFSVEEHNIIGGLGGAISEVIAELDTRTKLKRIGLNDCFAHGYGTQEQIRRMNSLDGIAISEIILKTLNR